MFCGFIGGLRAWRGKISNICILMYDFMQLPTKIEAPRFLERKLGKELPAKLRFASLLTWGLPYRTEACPRPKCDIGRFAGAAFAAICHASGNVEAVGGKSNIVHICTANYAQKRRREYGK